MLDGGPNRVRGYLLRLSRSTGVANRGFTDEGSLEVHQGHLGGSAG